ncbi:MAG: hypothetical protein QF733_08855 [Phycisphaerales bacterium]|jgi:hypothetical protein|nr:hypothetical protein [Phycisphaerales bacterium]
MLLVATAPAAANYRAWCHWDDLFDRLGGVVPSGSEVHAAIVEAEDGEGNYAIDECTPWACDPEFEGPLVTHKSGSSGTSNHARSVGKKFLGNTDGMAPDLKQIQCFELDDWIGDGGLHVGLNGQLPTGSGAVKVWNHSWVGDLGNNNTNREALRRMDWMVAHHSTDPIVCAGLNNSETQYPLLYNAYNVIAVGRRDGAHSWGDVQSPLDGAGRMRPDITGPLFTTSQATATISAAAAVLVDTVRLDDALPETAESSEVIKAVLMASADHSGQKDNSGDIWSNEPDADGPDRGRTSRPLDPIVGAGHLDVDAAHRVLTAGWQPGAPDTDAPADAPVDGWSLESMAAGDVVQWRLGWLTETDSLSLVATWHRTVETNFNVTSVADCRLEMLRVAAGSTHTLVGTEAGEVFDAGNVVSESSVDNVEHLYVEGLRPGHYIIRLSRDDHAEGQADVAIAWTIDGDLTDPDLDNDGAVGVRDLLELLQQWPLCNACDADLTGDGNLDLDDLIMLLQFWGT